MENGNLRRLLEASVPVARHQALEDDAARLRREARAHPVRCTLDNKGDTVSARGCQSVAGPEQPEGMNCSPSLHHLFVPSLFLEGWKRKHTGAQ